MKIFKLIGLCLTVTTIFTFVSFVVTIFCLPYTRLLLFATYLAIIFLIIILDDWLVEILNLEYRIFLGYFILGTTFSLIGLLLQWFS